MKWPLRYFTSFENSESPRSVHTSTALLHCTVTAVSLHCGVAITLIHFNLECSWVAAENNLYISAPQRKAMLLWMDTIEKIDMLTFFLFTYNLYIDYTRINMLVQWNVIMYAIVTLPLHWFQTNWTYYFSPCYFNGIKIEIALKCIFEETVPKLSENFGNSNSQDSHKNQYPGPVLNLGFTEPQHCDKSWLNMPPKCYIFPIDNTHRIISAIIRFML